MDARDEHRQIHDEALSPVDQLLSRLAGACEALARAAEASPAAPAEARALLRTAVAALSIDARAVRALVAGRAPEPQSPPGRQSAPDARPEVLAAQLRAVMESFRMLLAERIGEPHLEVTAEDPDYGPLNWKARLVAARRRVERQAEGFHQTMHG